MPPPVHASPRNDPDFCQDNKGGLEARSKELSAIAKADQDDRVHWERKTQKELAKVVKRDTIRRRRVGEIFGEGCFQTAKDFAAAAIVFQHGIVSEHFFQAFIWTQRAVELGDSSQKRLMALALDRYLVTIGHKQLFASQAIKPDFKPETCWCLQPIEESFPDERRKEISGKSSNEAYDGLKELNSGNFCPIQECKTELKPSPQGTVPGFW